MSSLATWLEWKATLVLGFPVIRSSRLQIPPHKVALASKEATWLGCACGND